MQNLNNVIIITVDTDHVGERIDKFIALHPLIESRTRAQFLIDSGFVLVNKKPIKSSYKVTENEEIQISLPPQNQDEEIQPLDLKLDILFEDGDIIVLNKPSGLVVHPAAGHHQDTLVNALVHHTKDLSMKYGEKRPGIVHRLDKETSGIMVVAKNDKSHEILTQKFKVRDIHRLYHAVAFGFPTVKSGKIESYLARHPIDRKKYASIKSEDEEDLQKGKFASTNYKLLKSYKNQLSYFELKLDTGRTHQIRIHLSEMGHPIIGDTVYGTSRKLSVISEKALQNEIRNLNRFALHATELGFKHPITQKELFFKSDWPQDMLSLLKKIGFT